MDTGVSSWENSFLRAFKPDRVLLKALGAIGGLPLLARLLERDACCNKREEVNIYTNKTPDYMLSIAQDYRKGYGGNQKHIRQTTLGQDAVCFTTHPAKIKGVTPNYWVGNGLLPRAAQFRNVAIVIYNIEKIPALYVPIKHFFTYAWLPKDKFDEVVEKNGWVFAHKDEGYLALHLQHPYFWTNDDTSLRGAFFATKQALVNAEVASSPMKRVARNDNKIVVEAARNIWLCQMGCKAEDGGFAEFVEKVTAARVAFSGMNFEFDASRLGSSDSGGRVDSAWTGSKSNCTIIRVTIIRLHGLNLPRIQSGSRRADMDCAWVGAQAHVN